MILLDTSAIYALADSRDANHERAVELAGRRRSNARRWSSTTTWSSRPPRCFNAGSVWTSATRFLRDAGRLRMHWVTEDDHASAVELHSRAGRRRLSLVDCVSFIVMRRLGIVSALAFDADFQMEGFGQYR